jgi:predicted Zn-ribbon and HTH transcriptional regulator
MKVKVDQMLEGWINFLRNKRPNTDISEEMKDLARTRAAVCNDCDSLVYSERRFGKKVLSRHKCSECGCSFPMLTFSKRKKCPLGKW